MTTLSKYISQNSGFSYIKIHCFVKYIQGNFLTGSPEFAKCQGRPS